jgi:RimJ/RimL family protein N-acetyltransferase
VLTDGFTRIDLDEIVSFTAAINERSQRVMQRLGMTFAGTFEHPRLAAGHPLRPHVLYRISRS